MALTMIPKDSAAVQAVVLRPICIGGERVEVDAIVTLTAIQYAELRAAAKVGPVPAKAAAKAKASASKSATQADPAAPSEAAAS